MKTFIMVLLSASLLMVSPARANVFTPITADPSYFLTFDDEFNGSAVDLSKWAMAPNGQPDTTDPNSPYCAYYYNSTNIIVANGVADLQITQVPFTCTKTGSTDPYVNNYEYHTVGMTTYYFQQLFGYWEARVKLPTSAPGVTAGVWTDAYNWQQPEIDMLEWGGNNPDVNHMTWHYVYPCENDPNCTFNIGDTHQVTIPGLGDGNFHVIGMFWTPSQINWYLDGNLVATSTRNVSYPQNQVKQWLLLSTTIRDFSDNLVTGSTVFPSHFQVDYVHIYCSEKFGTSCPPAVAAEANYNGPGDDGTGTPPPPPLPTASLAASPSTITAGKSSTLIYSSQNATGCVGTNFTATGTSGSVVVSPRQTTTYTLVCSNASGVSAPATATVTVRGKKR